VTITVTYYSWAHLAVTIYLHVAPSTDRHTWHRQRPGQEASLAPPCSNLRSLGSTCTVLKKVLVTLCLKAQLVYEIKRKNDYCQRFVDGAVNFIRARTMITRWKCLYPMPNQPKSAPPQKMLPRAPLMVVYKKKLCRPNATSRGRMVFKTKYSNCRHKFGRTRPVARFWGLGGKRYFYGGKILIFIIRLKQIFLSTTNLGDTKKIWGNSPRMLPVSARLGRTVARKSSIGALHVCAEG